MSINDTPHSVAFGSAVGIFFEFPPLFGVEDTAVGFFSAPAPPPWVGLRGNRE